MRKVSILFIFHLVNAVVAVTSYKKTPIGSLIGYGCGNSLQATLCVPKGQGYTFCPCVDINALGSFIYCGYQKVKNDNQKKELQKYLKNACPKLTAEMMDKAYDNVTDYLVDTTLLPSFNKSSYVNFPVYYNKTLYNQAYESYKHYTDNLTASIAWGSGLLAFWGCLLILGGIDHWGSRLFPTASLRLKKTVGQLRPLRWWRKNVSLPALFNEKHTTRSFIGGLMPTRFESVVLFIFFSLAVLAEALNLHTYRNSIIWKLQKVQLTRFIGDRTGVIAVFLMVPTYLFAGRNNFFLWITGWKQSTFFTFHKWLARMTIVAASVHAIVFVVNSVWLELYSYRITTDWWRFGSLAVVAGAVMFFQSLGFIRAYSYELFLYFHIVLAVLFLVGVWIHTSYYEYGGWAYASAAIWCFDRVVRLIRIAKFGIKTADVTLMSDEILVVTMPRGLRVQKPKPGSFGYVHFLSTACWFQSHPFTVLEGDDGKQKFLIKVKKGITKRLRDKLANEPNCSCRVTVAVEGFYGEYKQAYSYDEVIMISGGVGIPGIYEYISDIVKHMEAGKSKTKLIKFYWVIRHWESLDWFDKELKLLQQYDNVQTIVYVTKFHEMKVGQKFTRDESTSSEESSEPSSRDSAEKDVNEIRQISTAASSKDISRILGDFPHIEFRDSRPDFVSLIHEDILQAHSNHDVAVLSCGHNLMCDEVRKATSFEAGEPRAGRIDLFELLQLW